MKTIGFRLLILGTSLLVATFSAEIILRWLNLTYLLPELTETYHFPCYIAGTYYWVGLKKNATCILRPSQHDFPDLTIKTNSLGLRDKELSFEKPQGTTRILFLGDSYTFGLGVTDDQTYPHLVQDMLAAQTKKSIETINAGLVTAETGYYYLFLTHEGQRLSPDIVVIGFYLYNDAYDEEVKPVWTAVDENDLPKTIGSAAIFVDYTGALYTKGLPLTLKLPFLRDFQLLGLLTQAYYRLPWIKAETAPPLVTNQLCLYKPNCHKLDTDIARTKKLLTAIKAATDARGQKLLVVLIPAEFQIFDLARYKYHIPTALSPVEKQWPNQEFSTFLAHTGIDYLDLLPVFVTHKNPKPYYENDEHWNATGHSLVAQAIADKIRGYLRP